MGIQGSHDEPAKRKHPLVPRQATAFSQAFGCGRLAKELCSLGGQAPTGGDGQGRTGAVKSMAVVGCNTGVLRVLRRMQQLCVAVDLDRRTELHCPGSACLRFKLPTNIGLASRVRQDRGLLHSWLKGSRCWR